MLLSAYKLMVEASMLFTASTTLCCHLVFGPLYIQWTVVSRSEHMLTWPCFFFFFTLVIKKGLHLAQTLLAKVVSYVSYYLSVYFDTCRIYIYIYIYV